MTSAHRAGRRNQCYGLCQKQLNHRQYRRQDGVTGEQKESSDEIDQRYLDELEKKRFLQQTLSIEMRG